MFPLGHAAFAYLWYVGIAAVGRRPLPVHWGLVPLAVGSQLPDLLDKPLSYYGLLVSGRSLGHSVFTGLLLIVLVWLVSQRVADVESPIVARVAELTPLAFTVGYLSHLLADSLEALLAGRYGELPFLFWPVLSPLEYPNDDISPLLRLMQLYQHPLAHPQIELILLAGVIFTALEIRDRVRSHQISSESTN